MGLLKVQVSSQAGGTRRALGRKIILDIYRKLDKDLSKMADWREYEVQVSKRFKSYYPNCKVTHNAKKLGTYSKVLRQIDVLIEIELAHFKAFGVIECKYFQKAVDVPIVDRFIGFLEDVGADFGYLVTNVSFSEACRNRANAADVYLQIIEFARLDEYQFDLDDVINQKIDSLRCIEPIFLMRQEQRSWYVDLENTSLEKKVVTFKVTAQAGRTG